MKSLRRDISSAPVVRKTYRSHLVIGVLSIAAAVVGMLTPAAAGPRLPEIRMTGANQVPACVTPARLMSFLKARNRRLPARYNTIAEYYRQHGEAWRVRWDYAFYQMAIETNFLTYRAPSGRWGDVDPKQNNFAGLGTTGGGVPGDSFPNISSGVLGQIQHLVAYSGEFVDAPAAPRTALKQDHIIALSLKLNRPVRFSDLSGRWAVDRKYGASIEWVAKKFRSKYCRGQQQRRPSQRVTLAANAVKQSASEPVRTVWDRQPPKAQAPKPGEARARQPIKQVDPVAGPPPTLLNRPMPQADLAAKPYAPAVTAPDPNPQAITTVTENAITPNATLNGKAAVSDAGSEASNEPVPKFAMFTPPAWLATVARADAQPPNPEPRSTAKLAAKFKLPPSGLGMKPAPEPACKIESVELGPDHTVLIRDDNSGKARFVAVSVVADFEEAMVRSFIANRVPGAKTVGRFPSHETALASARKLCQTS